MAHASNYKKKWSLTENETGLTADNYTAPIFKTFWVSTSQFQGCFCTPQTEKACVFIITSSLRVEAQPCLNISILRRIGPCDVLTMFLSHMVFSTHMHIKYDQQIKMEKEVWRKHAIDLTTSQTKQLALVFLTLNPVFEFL